MRISVLELARDDLRDIHEYLLLEYGESPPAKFRVSFEDFCSNVMSMPYMYSKYKYNPLYRSAVIAYDYIVFYRVDEKSNIVEVYRVLHGKRSIEPLL